MLLKIQFLTKLYIIVFIIHGDTQQIYKNFGKLLRGHFKQKYYI